MLSGFRVPKSLPLEAKNSSLTGNKILLVVLEFQNGSGRVKVYWTVWSSKALTPTFEKSVFAPVT